jgi:hypothetical protein
MYEACLLVADVFLFRSCLSSVRAAYGEIMVFA